VNRPDLRDWDGPPFGVICSFDFVAGLGRAREPGEAQLAAPADGWSWTHLRLGDVRAQAALRHCPDLPPEALELFLGKETRIAVAQADGWRFGVLPDLERDLSGATLGAGRLIFAYDERRLVTGRHAPLRAIDQLRRQVERGAALPSPAAAVCELIEAYVAEVATMLDRLAEEIAGIEDYVLTEPANPREIKLSALRRAVARPRRDLQALRAALVRAQLGRSAPRASPPAEGFADLVPLIDDLDRDAAALQERGRLLHDEVDTLINSATNRSMRALTVISTLLGPPTLIVGAFGMNVPGIPFGHSLSGFALASGLCALMVGLTLVGLRRLGLIG
jgi:zinc transporter